MKKLLTITLIVALCAPVAQAFPELQIYIEGATYDDLSDDWTISATESVRLWTIADIGAKGRIDGVKLAIAYDGIYTPTFGITSSTTMGYNGFVDPSTPGAASFIQTVTDGSVPQLGGGGDLPSHGVYNQPGVAWQEFALGDYTLTDSEIADFNGLTDTPIPETGHWGQINVYDIDISGIGIGGSVHFDLYDHYYNTQGAKYVFAPPSHDGTTTLVPEPGTLALLGLGLAGLGARLRRKR